VIECRGILLSVHRRFPGGASSRFDMQSVNLVQMEPSRVSRVKLFARLGPPPAASVRLTSTRPRCGSLSRIATSTLVPAGMPFVPQ
jgi:hypothetical protein